MVRINYFCQLSMFFWSFNFNTKVIKYISHVIGITEANVESRSLDEALKDEHRISSIKSHLYYLHQAVK